LDAHDIAIDNKAHNKHNLLKQGSQKFTKDSTFKNKETAEETKTRS